MPPEIFEPPEAQGISAKYVVNCGSSHILIDYASSKTYFRLKKMNIGNRKVSNLEIAQLNSWLSDLRGSSFVRVFCGADGADFVFKELFTRDSNPFRSVEVIYKNGKFSLLKSAK